MSYVTSTKEFASGHQAVVVRTGVDADPASIAEALELPRASRVLLLSGGAGGMSKREIARLERAFTAIGEVLAREQVTVLDGGTRSGVMALMGQALDKACRTAPYIGVLPAHAEAGPDGLRGEDILGDYHSHFLLLESDEWGGEVETMGSLAVYLSDRAPPMVLLANGGEVALRDVEWHVQRGHEVFVLAGSGRLADEIAAAVRKPGRQTRDRVATVAREGDLTLLDLSSPPAELAESLEHRLKGENVMAGEQGIADTTARDQALEREKVRSDPAYVKWLKAKFEGVIDQLALTELEKQILKSRFLDQLIWLEGRANRARNWHRGLRLTAIISGVLIPVSVMVSQVASLEWVAWVATGLGVVVSIASGVDEFYHFGERWTNYRNTAELLKIEAWHFFQLSGPYSRRESHAHAYKTFAARTEGIIHRDLQVYISEMVGDRESDRDEDESEG